MFFFYFLGISPIPHLEIDRAVTNGSAVYILLGEILCPRPLGKMITCLRINIVKCIKISCKLKMFKLVAFKSFTVSFQVSFVKIVS